MTRQEIIDFYLTLPAAYEDYPFDNITEPGTWTVWNWSSGGFSLNATDSVTLFVLLFPGQGYSYTRINLIFSSIDV